VLPEVLGALPPVTGGLGGPGGLVGEEAGVEGAVGAPPNGRTDNVPAGSDAEAKTGAALAGEPAADAPAGAALAAPDRLSPRAAWSSVTPTGSTPSP
jgi:hypothetical protein